MENNNPYDDLSFIKQIIEESRQSIIYSHSSIVWALIISIALILTFISVMARDNSWINYVWFTVILMGWIYTAYETQQLKKNNKAKTLVDKLTGKVWFAIGISVSLIGLASLLGLYNNSLLISPLISSVIGAAYFITGEIHKKNWYRNLSIGWWIGAIFMFYFQNVYQLLVMAGMMILLQLIPSLILSKEAKKGKK